MVPTKDISKHTLTGTVIIIPAFNEAQAIGSVIREIREHCHFPIFVIDDASTDDTVTEAMLAGATVVPLAVQLGAWGAMQTGLRLAQRQGFEFAVTMDADGQHDAGSLKDLLRPVTEGVADVSIGACTQRGSRLRKFAWVLMKRASGLTLEDITSGFRVYNHRAIRELSTRRATLLDYQDVGVLLLLQARGLTIVDVNVAMQDRQNGASRIFSSWLIVFYYMCQTLLLGLTKRKLARSFHNPQAVR
jgi:glycosyltransferase involved in cell wall biosynthesis